MVTLLSGCLTIPTSDTTPPTMTIEVTTKVWPPGTTGHYSSASGKITDTLKLVDFESLHAVGTANDPDGGVFNVTVRAEMGRPCLPTPARLEKSNSDVPKQPGMEASRGRVVALDLKKLGDIPPCPNSVVDAVHIYVWAEGENFHGGKAVSPKVVLTLLP